MKLAKLFVPILLSLGFAHSAQAALITVSFGSSSDTNGVDFLFNLAVPTTIIGNATLSLTLDGDFGTLARENAEVLLDGLLLGTVADADPTNDRFNFANGDDPDNTSSAGNPVTGEAIITAAELSSLISDGLLALMVNTSASVNNDTTTVSGFITWDDGASAIPEPSTLLLFGLGLAALGFAKRRA